MLRRLAIIFFILIITILLLCLVYEAAAMSREQVRQAVAIPDQVKVITPTISMVTPAELNNNVDNEIEYYCVCHFAQACANG